MKKHVSVRHYNDKEGWTARYESDWVVFEDSVNNSVILPIEVFYQMWNSEEMISHMEEYHGRRKSDNSLNPT